MARLPRPFPRSGTLGKRSRRRVAPLTLGATFALVILAAFFRADLPWLFGEEKAKGAQGTKGATAEPFVPIDFERPARLRKGCTRVLRVVDGDTIKVLLNKEAVNVRLIGIDAPELAGARRAEHQPGALEAARWVETRLRPDPQARLEFDEERRDKYERLLAYVWIKGEAGEVMLNEELARAKLARPKSYPPNVRHRPRLNAAWKE